jgi:hypothetical protein
MRDLDHGSSVTAHVAGKFLGLTDSAQTIIVPHGLEERAEDRINEKIIHSLMIIADDIVRKGLQGRAVASLSIDTQKMTPVSQQLLRKCLSSV